MSLIHAVLHALSITGAMTWLITWALILGFTLSAMVQALVRKSTIVRLLGDDRPGRSHARPVSGRRHRRARTRRSRWRGHCSGRGPASPRRWRSRSPRPGLLATGAIAAWVPDSFWQSFFIAGHPLAAKIWGPLIGPVVAIISFVCSIGNIPLAVVRWKGGISFGGVIAFIFADLIIAPILNIYRKYYGARMALFLLGTFYAAMAAAGYVVELVFGGLGLIPDPADAKLPDQGVSWDYTTWLNIVFLTLGAALIIRFVRTGGVAMLRMMGGSPQDHMDAHVSHTH
jgi:uncharacterized membrane protein YraQ (UPF0718 family)